MAIKTLKYKYKYDGKVIEGKVMLNLQRFEGQYSKAQYELDSMVMTSMEPYMPMQTGTFINVTKGMSQAIAGSGKVYAAAPPMGRFLYEGKTMVDEKTGSPFARKGARKVLVSQFAGKTQAKPNLQFGRPEATDHWFDTAKKNHDAAWVKKAKKLAGGG